MRAWTRGEKIGFWSMVLGAITCIAVITSIPPVQSLVKRLFPDDSARSEVTGEDSTQLLLEAQRKLLEEQTTAAKQELLRLHEERVLLRQTRIDALAARYGSDGDNRQYDRVLLHNTCRFTIDVALYYMDLDDKFISRGWWAIPPNETVTTNAMTRNAYLYFYAENLEVGRVWDGGGEATAQELPVVNDKFDHLAGETFLYEGPRLVSFYQRKTGDAWGDHVESFDCPVEAPLPAKKPVVEALPPASPP